MTASTERQLFRETVALVAEKARATLPTQVNGRIESAVKLVLQGDVEPQADGTVQVGGSDPTRWYHLVGPTCTCTDFVQERAPEGWCKHRIAAGIQKRVQALLPQVPHGETEPAAAWTRAQADERRAREAADALPVPPLPEAPVSVTIRLAIGGYSDCFLTLRDHDDSRLLARLAVVLAQYPVVPSPHAQEARSAVGEAPDTGAVPTCPEHGAMKASTKRPGYYCPHKREDGTWCPSKGT